MRRENGGYIKVMRGEKKLDNILRYKVALLASLGDDYVEWMTYTWIEIGECVGGNVYPSKNEKKKHLH